MNARHLTLFVNPACHLCHIAKEALVTTRSTLGGEPPLTWTEIDISDARHSAWRDKYVFDVPVIHFTACGKSKLMHWVYPDTILAKLRESQGPETQWKTTQGKKEAVK